MRDPAGAVYRTKEEVEREKQRDPIVLFRDRATKAGLLREEELKHIEKDVNDLVDEAVAFADASPEPPLEELFTDIFREGA
jgi:pyruvate dehydrogenase E1 component alpha subunit